MTLCRSSGWANARPVAGPDDIDPRYETAECVDCWYRGPLYEVPAELGLPGTLLVLVPHSPVNHP